MIVPSPGRRLIQVQLAFRGSNPVVGNRNSPARFSRLIGNDKHAGGRVADECMFKRIDHELGDMRPILSASADETVPRSRLDLQ